MLPSLTIDMGMDKTEGKVSSQTAWRDDDRSVFLTKILTRTWFILSLQLHDIFPHQLLLSHSFSISQPLFIISVFCNVLPIRYYRSCHQFLRLHPIFPENIKSDSDCDICQISPNDPHLRSVTFLPGPSSD